MNNMTVLVVDDEQIVLDSCRIILSAEQCRVTCTESAEAALVSLGESLPDVMLVDVKMPGRDGISLLKEIHERWPEVPVIIMSGYPTEDTIADARGSGAGMFLSKPFTPDELLDAVRRVIGKE